MSKDILTIPLSLCPTAAEVSLSLEAGRAQLGQAEGAEASFDEYSQEAGLETEHSLIPGIFTFVHSGRHGERAERSEFRNSSNKHLRFFVRQRRFQTEV